MSKTFNDPIHGHIELSPLSISIIDTPQYQRLRDISQLGGVYFVFPGAASKRFEHCIGVAHLAKTFVKQLKLNQPELEITVQDELCVEIAGLCHDIGHGPYSHLFDGCVIPKLLPSTKFHHEHASIGIFQLLIDDNNLIETFHKYNLTSDDIHFIKELMLGDESEAPIGFEWKGRGKKTFLYDIVANKRNGIDVDKFDYFARDCHVLGITKSFDCYRLMRFARVMSVIRNTDSKKTMKDTNSNNKRMLDAADDKIKHQDKYHENLEICFHVKEAWNICELFHTRYALHKRAYQHKVAGAIELMITEALILANPYLLFKGQNNKPTKMSECINDFHAYWKLGDYVVKQIESSSDTNLLPSQMVIERLRKRDLFCCVGELLLSPSEYHRIIGGSNKIKNELISINKSRYENKNEECLHPDVVANDVFITLVKMGYGKGGEDPVSELTTFFKPNKDEGDYMVGIIPPDSLSRLTPREYEETYVRIFSRHKSQEKILRSIFNEWADSQELNELSPLKKICQHFPAEGEVYNSAY